MASEDPAQAELAIEGTSVVNKYDRGWRRIIRHFSPSWFSVTMGTGIVSVLLVSIPYQADWLYNLSIVFFVLNLVFFILAFLVSVLRYTLYPEIWSVMVRDPKNSLYLACVPMGFATLVEMALVVGTEWGNGYMTFVWALWIIDAVFAVAVTVSLCFILISADRTTNLAEITATQLLPAAATIVAAGAGSRVAALIPETQRALGVVIACYILWGMGTPLAMLIIAIYYQRLAIHKLPPREVLVSCFLPLGPLGFGGYGIMNLGRLTLDLFPQTHTLAPVSTEAATILYVVGLLMALIMWGFGLVWLAFAVATIWLNRPLPFNMGWWGFTFPLGVYAASTLQIGAELPSAFFRVLGTIFATAVVALWLVVAARTLHGAVTGKLFYAPCLHNLKPEYVKKGLVNIGAAEMLEQRGDAENGEEEEKEA